MKIDDSVALEIKNDFPILKRAINGNQITYLDNAATSQRPNQVIDAISNYYKTSNANIHRGIYQISEESTKIYEDSKKVVASFINSQSDEIIYTRSATESANLVAYSLEQYLKNSKKSEIVVSEVEHHSNLVPWQQLAKRLNMKFVQIKLTDDFTLDMEDAKSKINEKTAILAITHVSNTLGTEMPVKDLVKLASSHGALTYIDAAQSAPHIKLDVKNIDCDFLAFSSHKMLGPMGIGVLYGKKKVLTEIPPFNFGGDMIKDVKFEETEWNDVPMKFEAGTVDVAGAVGLAKAIEYLENIGMENVSAWEKELSAYAVKKLSEIDSIKIYRTKNGAASGIVSFTIDGFHHHDIASYLNDFGVCIRVGHHCTMPFMDKMKITGTARLSFYIYSTHKDVDICVDSIKKGIELFKK